jgi:hypothetical protein
MTSYNETENARLLSIASLACVLEEGSEAQLREENEFSERLQRRISPDRLLEWQRTCLKATRHERIERGLLLLGLSIPDPPDTTDKQQLEAALKCLDREIQDAGYHLINLQALRGEYARLLRLASTSNPVDR